MPHERVAALIADADIGIDPAPGTELNHGSTMIKVAEYMGCGRPVVAYDLRETRRTAGDAALYAPCGERQAFVDLIGELARDGERRLRLGRLARERALELTWDRSEEALRAVYRAPAAAEPRAPRETAARRVPGRQPARWRSARRLAHGARWRFGERLDGCGSRGTQRVAQRAARRRMRAWRGPLP